MGTWIAPIWRFILLRACYGVLEEWTWAVLPIVTLMNYNKSKNQNYDII